MGKSGKGISASYFPKNKSPFSFTPRNTSPMNPQAGPWWQRWRVRTIQNLLIDICEKACLDGGGSVLYWLWQDSGVLESADSPG